MGEPQCVVCQLPVKGYAHSAMSEGSTHNILLLLSLNFACFYIDYRVFNSHAKP